MQSLVGKTLGPYQIVSELGCGGMAVVYKAHQSNLNRYVAIKVLPPEFAFDVDFLRRFDNEAKAAAQLSHPNIVVIHDVGHQDGFHYIVMNLLEGVTLKAMIERKVALSEKRTAKIVEQIASALEYAHSQGFVHRDVKPANIIIGANDHATLTDFGITKAIEGTRLTQTGAAIGTPEYMSPEQARGEMVDYRTDIYSLGVVVYEILGGRVPFSGTTPLSVLLKITQETPPPLRSTNPRVSMAIEQVVNTALAKDPARRYARASDFARSLNAAAKELSAPPSPPEGRNALSPIVGISIAAVAGIFLIVLIIGLALMSRPSPAVDPPRANAITIVNAHPYELATLSAIPAGQSIGVTMNAEKTARVLDLFFEIANDAPSEISAFVSPYCDTSIFVGSTRIEASQAAHPVWIHVGREVLVSGKFCVRIQATAGVNTSIGQNDLSQYLVRVVVSNQ